MNDDRHPFKTTIREIDFEEAFEICEKGRVSYFGKKWDGNNPNPIAQEGALARLRKTKKRPK